MSPSRPGGELLLCVDHPVPGAATSRHVVVRGWAARRGGGRIERVEARIGERRVELELGGHRPDVAAALAEREAEWSGFDGRLVVVEPAEATEERLVVRAWDEHGGSAEVEAAIRVLPNGREVLEIERARRAAGRIEVEGWALWPEGSPPFTVALVAGGRRLAGAKAHLSRPDVANRFPLAPRGNCRGFRLVAWVEPGDAPEALEGALELVCVDARGRRLEHALRISSEPEDRASGRRRAAARAIETAAQGLRRANHREPVILDWGTGLGLRSLFPTLTVFEPPADAKSGLPYLDRSIDVVAVDETTPDRLAEARRVASAATVEAGVLRWSSTARRPAGAPEATVLVHAGWDAAAIGECLDALRGSLPDDFRGEVLVVDDLATEAVRQELRRWRGIWPRLSVVRNERRLDFAGSANRGAEVACAGVVVFLDPALRPRPGWLPPLLDLMERDPDVGAVGGKLVSADGRELLAGPASLRPNGRRRPEHPTYEFVHDVEAAAAGLLAVRRARFLELGGFDPEIASPDEAADDLCARLRRKGLRIRFQPAAVAAVVPGSVTDRRSREDRAPRSVAARRRTAKRVLVSAPRMPEFDREAGSRRVFHFVELLLAAGWEVSYLALESVDGDRYVRLLQQLGVAVYAGPESIGAGDEYVESLDELFAEERFDLAIVAFWRVAERLLPLLRDHSPRTRVIVDSIDLHYLREERAALARAGAVETPENRDRRLARRERELAAYAAADAVLAVSEREARLIEEVTDGGARAFYVPIPESLERSRAGFTERTDLLFMGNFRHRPNLEGLEFLCRDVLPRLGDDLLGRFPLAVVGNEVDDRVRALVAEVPHARVVGWVPSVVPYLEAARVSLVSLLSGAGTKGKLVQALMVGTPSVATSIGVEGLDLVPGRHVLVADSAEAFADAIRRLATDPVLWTRLAREGREHILRSHGRESVGRRLLEAIEATLAARVGRSIRSAAG